MPKPRKSLRLALRPYPPRSTTSSESARSAGLSWRRDTFEDIIREAKRRRVRYTEEDRLRVTVLLYLSDAQMRRIDVDNLVKHLGDALQGNLGGQRKKQRRADAVLPNDSQIFSWTVEKRRPVSPKLKSRLLVQRYKPS